MEMTIGILIGLVFGAVLMYSFAQEMYKKQVEQKEERQTWQLLSGKAIKFNVRSKRNKHQFTQQSGRVNEVKDSGVVISGKYFRWADIDIVPEDE